MWAKDKKKKKAHRMLYLRAPHLHILVLLNLY